MREQHGLRNSPTYSSWLKMRGRCNDPKNNRYMRYGGRGIKVCDAWNNSFCAFFKDMGERPDGMTLDRIDVNKDYELENCRWATEAVQKRDSQKLITFNGQTKSITEWATYLGIRQSALSMRLGKYGWSVERALSPLSYSGRDDLRF
jgi:hypothetical protein